MKNNGFTIIETLIALTLGTTITAGAVSYQSDRSKDIMAEKTIQEINSILKNIDKKIKENGLERSNWADSAWSNESEIISKLINDELNMSLWSEGLEESLFVNANINYDSSDFFQNFNFYLSFDSEKSFESNFKHFNKASRIKSLRENEKMSVGNYTVSLYSDSTKQNITTQDCLADSLNCQFHFSYNRIGGGEYLRANPDSSLSQNQIKDGRIKFIDSTNGAPYKCIPWQKTKAGAWEIKSSADNIPCGIGLYDNGTGTNEIFSVDVAANNGSFETLYLNGLCELYSIDNERIKKEPNKVRCAIKNDTEIVQIVENINANKAIIETVYSKDGKFNELYISNNLKVINEANITEMEANVMEANTVDILEELTSKTESNFNNVIFENKANFNNSVTVNTNTELKTKNDIEGNINLTTGLSLVSLNKFTIGETLSVDKDSKVNNLTSNAKLEVLNNTKITGSLETHNMTITNLIESISMKAQTGDFENINIELNMIRNKIQSKCSENRVECRGNL